MSAPPTTTPTTTRPTATMPVRALSIRQPWAALILAGHKGVENRTWATRWRGTLVIHAGTRPDLRAAALAVRHGLGDIIGLPGGAYLGAVELTDVHHHDRCRGCDPWAEPGCWHWVLSRPRRLARPVPAPGRLGLWRPPAGLLGAALIGGKRR